MKFGPILTLAFAMLSTSAIAATLTVADNIELEVVNGEAYKKSGLFFQSNDDVELPNGAQQLVFRIFDNFRSGNEQDLFRSQYYVMTFADQGNKTLKIAAAPLKNLATAQKFDANPKFTLIDNNGQSVPFKLAPLKKDGMQVSRNLVEDLAKFNATGHEAAIESRASFLALAMNNDAGALPTRTQATAQGSNAMAPKGSALVSEQMLRYWFEQADHNTRIRFLEWAQRSMKATNKK